MLCNCLGWIGTQNLVDVRLHQIMKLISGTFRPTPLAWLPVLSNIEALRRKADKLLAKAENHEDWGLHNDIADLPPYRLSSKRDEKIPNK